MDEVEKVLKKEEYSYKNKRNKNVSIYIINDEKMIISIKNRKDNIFSITREMFNTIDDELLPYSFILIDNNDNYYFYKINEPNNSIRKAFDNTKKDVIYFGKEILNSRLLISDIKKYIDKIQ